MSNHRFAKPKKIESEKQNHYRICIVHGCPLPTYGFNADGVRVICLYHELGDSDAISRQKTQAINDNMGLIKHYLKWLRNKTPVELMLV